MTNLTFPNLTIVIKTKNTPQFIEYEKSKAIALEHICTSLLKGKFISKNLSSKLSIKISGVTVDLNPNNHVINYYLCIYKKSTEENSPLVLTIANESKWIPILKCVLGDYPYTIDIMFNGNEWICEIPAYVKKYIKQEEGKLRYQCEYIVKGQFIPEGLDFNIYLNVSGILVKINPNNHVIMTPLCIYRAGPKENSSIVLAMVSYKLLDWKIQAICQTINRTYIEITYNGKEWACR